jgi:hypothetical protein
VLTGAVRAAWGVGSPTLVLLALRAVRGREDRATPLSTRLHEEGISRAGVKHLRVCRRPGALVLCALIALLSGCGRAQDDRAVSAVTERFVRAVQAHDGARACAQLSTGAVQALEHDEGERCAKAVVGLDIRASAARRSQVFGGGAKVDLADGHSAFLELTRRGWRVSAAGCAPEGGDKPYTCEVQA